MDVLRDERFSGIAKDPRFKKVPKKHTKMKIDERFHGLFSNKTFQSQRRVDKRGSRSGHKTPEDYRKFYQLDEEDARREVNSSDDDSDSDDDDDDYRKDSAKRRYDEADAKSAEEPKVSSDGDDSGTSTDLDSVDSEEEDRNDHHWRELDVDAPPAEVITRRLAVCNMDWDRLRAEDFFVVFNSFKPPDGIIHSVKIYPSEYGLECMEKEKVNGPAALIEDFSVASVDDDDDAATTKEKLSARDREKLRRYQINRLKYFFAVVDCDSPKTADALYDHLNGTEYEDSGCILDLRFIPDDRTFEQEPVSVADSSPSPSDYNPVPFVTTAVSHVKVHVTWDENDLRRTKLLENAFADPESVEKDLKKYLASSSESEDEAEESEEDAAGTEKLNSKEAIAKYKALLQTLEEKEKEKENEEEFDIEITWEPGLKEKTEKLVKEKISKENLTPFEEELQKQRELKKRRKEKRQNLAKAKEDNSSSEESDAGENDQKPGKKGHRKNKLKSPERIEEEKMKTAELALLMADSGDNSSDSDDSSYKSHQKKKKKKKLKIQKEKREDVLESVDDPRFAAIYTNPLFHVDPSHQSLKAGKKLKSLSEMVQRKEKFIIDPNPVSSHKILQKESDVFKGLKEKDLVPAGVENTKKKIVSDYIEFENAMKLKLLEKQSKVLRQKVDDSSFMGETSGYSLYDTNSTQKRKKKLKKKNTLQEGHSSFMTDSLVDTSFETGSSRKRKKQLLEKQDFSVDRGECASSSNATFRNGSTCSAYVEDDDDNDPDVMIFSSGSAKKQTSKFPVETPHHIYSVRKKAKKLRTS